MRSAFLVAPLAALGACGDAPAPPPGPGDGAGAPRTAADLEAELDELGGIGYVDFSGEPPDDHPDGAQVLDAARWSGGHTLVTSIPHGAATLYGPDGEVLRGWSVPDCRWLRRAELLPDGDVLVVGATGGRDDADLFLGRLDWDGEVEWRLGIAAHHDVELTPDGYVAVLTMDRRTALTGPRDRAFKNDYVQRHTPEGDYVDRYSIFAALNKRPDLLELAYRPDRLHTNSLAFFDQPHLVGTHPLYHPDHVLLSVRNQDAVAIVDHAKGRLLWAWGPGEVIRQHEASWLPNGNVLLFDNGDGERGWSRALEVDPRTDAITWEYRATRPEDLFSDTRGQAQGLPGDNVLIVESNRGLAIEVTRAGDVVWRFANPRVDDEGRRAAIRAQRYPGALVDGVRAARGE